MKNYVSSCPYVMLQTLYKTQLKIRMRTNGLILMQALLEQVRRTRVQNKHVCV